MSILACTLVIFVGLELIFHPLDSASPLPSRKAVSAAATGEGQFGAHPIFDIEVRA
jgi:hypothetical protein